MSRTAATWVDRAEDLDALAARLAGATRVALDTEGNSLHAYRERTCVVQLATDAESAIVDPLALPSLLPLGAALARPGLEVVLHGGDYDVSVLSRDHGIAFERVFDTMIAATLLAEPRVGLADLLRTHLGVELDKRWQTADWARRPVSPEQVAYLEGDVSWLLALRDLLAARLVEHDLLEEAEIEFRRLARRRGRAAEPDPEGWRRAKGAEALDPVGRAALHELWTWRESEAARRDLPPFKVVGPQSLVELARHARSGADAHGPLRGVSPREADRHGHALREALRRGLAAERAGRAPAPPARPVLSDEERGRVKRTRAREDRLRDWRRQEAAQRGVPNVVVLPNPALEDLAARAAVSVDELAQHPDVGAKRAARYGAALVRLLADETD
jgi:ribonuclease D